MFIKGANFHIWSRLDKKQRLYFRSYFFELSLAFLSIGIKLFQEHSLCSCRETQPLINGTSLGFFHLETESKETLMGVTANQLHLTHGIWGKCGSYYSRGSVWNNREEIWNCNAMKIFLEHFSAMKLPLINFWWILMWVYRK